MQSISHRATKPAWPAGLLEMTQLSLIGPICPHYPDFMTHVREVCAFEKYNL
jgi:hypothetical protein